MARKLNSLARTRDLYGSFSEVAMIPIIILIGIAISTHDPLKILIKLMTGTVNGDPLKPFKQHLKVFKDHLQEPLPDLKDLTINI